METHVRRFVIAEPGKYELYKKQLEEYNQQRQELMESYPTVKWGEYVKTGKIADPTVRAAIQLERLDAAHARARFYVKCIDDVMDKLPERQRQIIEQLYIKKRPMAEIEMSFYLDSRTIYRDLQEALPLFAIRNWGYQGKFPSPFWIICTTKNKRKNKQ